MRRIASAASGQGISWQFIRHGARHDVYRLGAETIPIPRHSEIKESTARGIMAECDPELGKDWWK